MKYDNRHAYTIEREREEDCVQQARTAAIGEDSPYHVVLSAGKPIIYAHGIITGFVMMNSRGEYACDVLGDGLVKIPAPGEVLN